MNDPPGKHLRELRMAALDRCRHPHLPGGTPGLGRYAAPGNVGHERLCALEGGGRPVHRPTRIRLLQTAIQGYERRISEYQDQIEIWKQKVIELERVEAEEERVWGVQG